MKIEIKDLCLKFKKNVLFSNFSYTFDKNGLYLLKGESGSGKSTLLSAISGMRDIDQGDILIDDKSIKSMSLFKTYKVLEKDLIYISPEESLISELTVMENLNLANVEIYKDDEYIKLFSLENKLLDYGRTLSQGERIKVSLLIALKKKYKVLLLDEISASMDIKSKNELVKILDKLKQDKIIILTTHEDVLFDSICDDIIFIKNKQVIFDKDNNTLNSANNNINKNIDNKVEQDLFIKNNVRPYFNNKVLLLKLFRKKEAVINVFNILFAILFSMSISIFFACYLLLTVYVDIYSIYLIGVDLEEFRANLSNFNTFFFIAGCILFLVSLFMAYINKLLLFKKRIKDYSFFKVKGIGFKNISLSLVLEESCFTIVSLILIPIFSYLCFSVLPGKFNPLLKHTEGLIFNYVGGIGLLIGMFIASLIILYSIDFSLLMKRRIYKFVKEEN